jgi:adenylate kinase
MLAFGERGLRKYVIMGPQGSGKGTQAKRLREAFDLVHISVGDIFRWNIQSHTKLGARIRRYVDAGELVPDDVVGEIVLDRLNQHDWNFGFVLDGFPRSERQALFFLETFDIDAVIEIALPAAAATERMLGRRLCGRCGLDYNLIYHRPAREGACDVCGGALETRSDDSPQAIAARLRGYHAQTAPILDLFRRKELVVTVDGACHPDEVYRQICRKLGLSEGGQSLTERAGLELDRPSRNR